MRRIRSCCWARAASGHAVAEPTIALTKSRRRIACPKRSGPRQIRRRLQQGFTTGEMGFRGQFAQRQSETAHVRFGSKADIAASPTNVRFTPKSGHRLKEPECLLCANSTRENGIELTCERELNWECQSVGGASVKHPRRKVLHLATGAAALSVLPRVAWALDYPSRPVHIVVGFPAGGDVDIVARLIGQWLSERIGQRFIVENRPGAGGNVSTEVVVRASPDGYTLLLVG